MITPNIIVGKDERVSAKALPTISPPQNQISVKEIQEHLTTEVGYQNTQHISVAYPHITEVTVEQNTFGEDTRDGS